MANFVLAQLPDGDFILIGESFSGNVAYQIAKTRPEHLKSVIFIVTFLSNPRPLLLKLFNFLPGCLLSIKPPKFIIKSFLLGFSVREKTIQIFLGALKKTPSSVLSSRLKQIEKLKLSPNEESLKIEATYIQATKDFLVPTKALNDFDKVFSNLTVAKVKGPHFVLQANPEKCSEIIVDTIHIKA